jgi:hypothetical protein
MLNYIPTNEQEVVYLFAFVCEKLNYTVDRVQTDFPDCILSDSSGNKIKAEFEYRTSNFIIHGHPIDECDLVIAWQDDCNLQEKIKVIELYKYFPDLQNNPDINTEDIKINKTLEGLALILRDEANKENLEELFQRYHIKEQAKEPVRFVARLIQNGGEPYIENGKLKLKNNINKEEMKYGVSNNTEAMQQAASILEALKIKTV